MAKSASSAAPNICIAGKHGGRTWHHQIPVTTKSARHRVVPRAFCSGRQTELTRAQDRLSKSIANARACVPALFRISGVDAISAYCCAVNSVAAAVTVVARAARTGAAAAALRHTLPFAAALLAGMPFMPARLAFHTLPFPAAAFAAARVLRDAKAGIMASKISNVMSKAINRKSLASKMAAEQWLSISKKQKMQHRQYHRRNNERKKYIGGMKVISA